MNSLILTAGKGTRFKPYTDELAKPAIEFLTLPMMMYSRYFAEYLQSKAIVFNLHHLPETIKAINEKYSSTEFSLLYSDETSQLLDSGGGIKKAINENFSGEHDVFVSNGDNICIIDPEHLKKALKHHNDENNDLTILVGTHQEAGKSISALYADPNLNLKDKGLSKSKDLNPYHYLGMMFFNSKILSKMPEEGFSLFDDGVIPHINNLKVKLFIINEYLWFETGNPKDFLNATKQCLKQIQLQTEHGKILEKIIKNYRPNIEFEFNESYLLASCSSKSIKSSSIEGFATIGDHCIISDCTINNSVIQSYATLNQKKVNDSYIIK